MTFYLNVPNKVSCIWGREWLILFLEFLLLYLVNKGNSAENVVDFPALNILIQKIKKIMSFFTLFFSSQILCGSCFLI